MFRDMSAAVDLTGSLVLCLETRGSQRHQPSSLARRAIRQYEPLSQRWVLKCPEHLACIADFIGSVLAVIKSLKSQE